MYARDSAKDSPRDSTTKPSHTRTRLPGQPGLDGRFFYTDATDQTTERWVVIAYFPTSPRTSTLRRRPPLDPPDEWPSCEKYPALRPRIPSSRLLATVHTEFPGYPGGLDPSEDQA